jgi:hypothetical protein
VTTAGTLAATIANDAVTYSKMQNVSAASKLLGRGDSSAGDVEEITLGTNLTLTGTTLSASGGSGTGDVVGPTASVDDEVALYSGVTGKLLKRSTGTGLARLASGVQSASELSGDVTTSGSNVVTIANDAVTYAKQQNVSAASKLLGRGSASGSGDCEEITLGTNLSMSGTTLNASGSGGGTLYDNSAATGATTPGTGEQTVYGFNLVGGDLTATKKLRVTLRGTILANSGTPTFTFRVKLGATTLWGDISVGLGAMATRAAFMLDFILANLNVTNSQAMLGMFSISNRAAAASVAGIGDIGATGLGTGMIGGVATEDTTSTLAVAVTVVMSVNNAAVEVLRQIAFAELIG